MVCVYHAHPPGKSPSDPPWQVNDLGMQLSNGFFRLNGSCGYVLKPDWQTQPGASLGKVLAQSSTG